MAYQATCITWTNVNLSVKSYAHAIYVWVLP